MSEKCFSGSGVQYILGKGDFTLSTVVIIIRFL